MIYIDDFSTHLRTLLNSSLTIEINHVRNGWENEGVLGLIPDRDFLCLINADSGDDAGAEVFKDGFRRHGRVTCLVKGMAHGVGFTILQGAKWRLATPESTIMNPADGNVLSATEALKLGYVDDIVEL